MARPESSILHIDLDAFYAAVEVLDDPSLVGRPVIVGGVGNRGVVASCSYEARAYGVASAMPAARARRLCPGAVFIAPRPPRYREYSRRFHAILNGYTPLVEGIGLDEAFMDVGGARRLWGSGPEIAVSLRHRVGAELGLLASVGVATTMLVAKLACEAAKPTPSPAGPVARPAPTAGVRVVEPGAEIAFLRPLPVSALWGVGPATRRRLGALGIITVGDLGDVAVSVLERSLGVSSAARLHRLAWAQDDRVVTPLQPARSVGQERTFERDLVDRAELGTQVRALSYGVAAQLRDRGLAGRTVELKVRFADFTTLTRSRTLSEPVDTADPVTAVALELLDALDIRRGVRLVGVRMARLGPRPAEQLTLRGSGKSQRELAEALDLLRHRFGDVAVAPGSVVTIRPPRGVQPPPGPVRSRSLEEQASETTLLADRSPREDGPESGRVVGGSGRAAI